MSFKSQRERREAAKRAAAAEAVKHVEEGFVVGLGSGSTAAYAIEGIGRRIREEGIRVLGIPTSYQAYLLALKHGIPLTTLDQNVNVNLTIDGADQADRNLNLIKGYGGALLREKVVASASKEVVIVIDETKIADKLGVGRLVPIEVLPFAFSYVLKRVKELGGRPKVREGKGKVGPMISDNGNFLVDVDFGAIDRPDELDTRLRAIPGVVETGLFINLAHVAYVGKFDGSVERIERNVNLRPRPYSKQAGVA